MPKILAGLACPVCDRSGTTSQLYQSTPSLAIFCESGNTEHVWRDTTSLYDMNPRKLDVPKRVQTRQVNHVNVEVKLPQSTLDQLKAKHGERFDSSLTAILQACADPEIMILNTTDLDRIQERTGTRPKSSSELFGLLFQLGEEVETLRIVNKDLERKVLMRKGGANTEGVTVDLGKFYTKAVQKAKDTEYPVDEYLSRYLQDSLENDWIVV